MTQREAARAVAAEPAADTTPPASEPGPSTGGPASRPDRRRIIAALAVLAVLAGAAAGYWLYFVRGIVSSDDARIAADLVDVSPQVGGTLETLQVGEGDSVEAGQVLFVLDDTTLDAALKHALAQVDAARARVAIARAGAAKALNGPRAAEIRIAIAAKESADAQARLAEAEWKRTQALFEQKVVTEANLLRAQTQWERAQRGQAEAESRLKLLYQGTRDEDLAAARASVEAAEAGLAAAEAAATQAQVAVDHATVHAPFAGIVVRKWRDAGAAVGVATPVVTLLNPATLHVAANIDEKDLARVAVGDRVDIAVDAFPSAALRGHVQRVLRATNSQFGLIPSEGVSGTFIKVAQRVPLSIALDGGAGGLPLAPGLSVEVRIHSGTHAARSKAVTARD